MNAGEIHEYEAAADRLLDLVACVFVHAVPLVERDDQGASGLENVTQQMQVLFDDAFTCVEHKHYYMSVLNSLQRFNDGKFFDGLRSLATLADARGIDECIVLAPPFKWNVDAVACGAGLVINHYPFFAEHTIDQSRLAYV